MSGQYVPAGFESYKRKDYFDSDEDDELNYVVYPISKPEIKVVPVPDETESTPSVQSSTDQNGTPDETPSKSPSEEGELEDCVRFKREYSVNRYTPQDEGSDGQENDQQVKNGDNGNNQNDQVINWFNDDQPSSSNSLSPDPSRNRETRSPSPGLLILEDVRLATLEGNLEYIKHKMTVDHGFFIDSILKNGWTILMIACDFGFLHIVQYCLENNADPNFHYDGFTALMAVCQSFYAEEDVALKIVELLLKAGANVDSKDFSNKTALLHACETGKSEVALYLVQNGADVTVKDNKQWNCLHFGARKGFGPVVRHMIDNGAKLNTYNNFGQSPADLALESGFHELGVLLQRLKADEEISIGEEAIFMKPKGEKLPFKTEERYYLTDMQHFLGSIGLSHLVDFFEKQKILYADLMSFNECDLDALAIENYGEKLKLWEGIKLGHRRNWQPSRNSLLKRKSQISCLEVHVILCNISHQMKSMNTTFKYLRNHLKNDPELVKRGADKTSVLKLYEQAKMTFGEGGSSSDTLESLIQDISNLIDKSNGSVQNKRTNHVNGNKIQRETKPKIGVQSISHSKVAMVISGLVGLSALVYFNKDSIASILPK